MSESKWYERPLEEKSSLDDKIEKLSVFLDSTIFATSAVDEDEKALLSERQHCGNGRSHHKSFRPKGA
jgi:hypothetical protein